MAVRPRRKLPKPATDRVTELTELLPAKIRHNAWTAAADATDAINELGATLTRLRAENEQLRAENEQLRADRVALADEIEQRRLNPADNDWDNGYNTALADAARLARGDRRPGLNIVRDAIRQARGGDAPPQIQGYA